VAGDLHRTDGRDGVHEVVDTRTCANDRLGHRCGVVSAEPDDGDVGELVAQRVDVDVEPCRNELLGLAGFDALHLGELGHLLRLE
jgi:hypothetical protein